MEQQYERGNTIYENNTNLLQMTKMSQRRQMEKLTSSLDTSLINMATKIGNIIQKVVKGPAEKEWEI